MAIDKTQAIRKGAAKANKSAQADKFVPLLSAVTIKNHAIAAIDNMLALETKTDNAGHAIAADVMQLWALYRQPTNGPFKAADWTRMVLPDRKLADVGKAFVKHVKMEVLGDKPMKPSKTSTRVAYTEANIALEKKHVSRSRALERAAQLAIAAGYYGGVPQDYNKTTGVMSVDKRVFLPAFTHKQAEPWRFQFTSVQTGKVALDGSIYTLERPLPDNKVDYAGGKFSMAQAVTVFYSTPKSGRGEVAQVKGADDKNKSMLEPAVIKAALAASSFDALLLQTAACIAPDQDGKPDGGVFTGEQGAKLSNALDALIAYRVACMALAKTAPVKVAPKPKPAPNTVQVTDTPLSVPTKAEPKSAVA